MTKFKAVKSDSEVIRLATKIIKRFSEELGHINVNDIHFAWRISSKSRYHGKTHLIRGEDKMFTDKKVVIVLWLRSWKEHDPAWRALLLYHEMRHVLPKRKVKGEYSLVRHNLEDFVDIVNDYGPRWERANNFMQILESGRKQK